MNRENKSTPPFQSKLIPYEKDIMDAWFQRQTLREIQRWLQENHQISIALSSLSVFIQRRRKRQDPHKDQVSNPQKKKNDLADLDGLLEKDIEEIKKEWYSRERLPHRY